MGDGLSQGTTHGPLNNSMQFTKAKEIVEDRHRRAGAATTPAPATLRSVQI